MDRGGVLPEQFEQECKERLHFFPQQINDLDDQGVSLLHRAVASGLPPAVSILLSCNQIDPNVVATQTGITPLLLAARRSDITTMEQLLRAGASPLCRDLRGQSVMHYAVLSGQPRSVAYLSMRCGLTFDAVDEEGSTLLHTACQSATQTLMVQYLLRRERCSPSTADRAGNLPVHIAAYHSLSHICYLLVRHGGPDTVMKYNLAKERPNDCAKNTTLSDPDPRLSRILFMYSMTGVPARPFEWYLHSLGPSMVYITGLLLSHLYYPESAYIITPCALAVFLLWTWWTPEITDLITRSPSHSRQVSFMTHCLSQVGLFYYLETVDTTYKYGFMFAVHTLTTAAFLLIFYRNPGIIFVSRLKPNPGPTGQVDRFTLLDLAAGAGPPTAWCPVCEIVPTRPARHCVLCARCVHTPSHHSRRAGTCVAAKNHRGFVWYHIAYLTASLALFLYVWYSDDFGHYLWRKDDSIWRGYSWQTSVCVTSMCYGLVAAMALWSELSAVSVGRTPFYKSTSRVGFSISQKVTNVFRFLVCGDIQYKDPVMLTTM